jgi:hypothetical protein
LQGLFYKHFLGGGGVGVVGVSTTLVVGGRGVSVVGVFIY